MGLLTRLLTNNKKNIPLMWMEMDAHTPLVGTHIHPTLNDDAIFNEKVQDLVNYIKEEYEPEDF